MMGRQRKGWGENTRTGGEGEEGETTKIRNPDVTKNEKIEKKKLLEKNLKNQNFFPLLL